MIEFYQAMKNGKVEDKPSQIATPTFSSDNPRSAYQTREFDAGNLVIAFVSTPGKCEILTRPDTVITSARRYEYPFDSNNDRSNEVDLLAGKRRVSFILVDKGNHFGQAIEIEGTSQGNSFSYRAFSVRELDPPKDSDSQKNELSKQTLAANAHRVMAETLAKAERKADPKNK